MVKIHKPPSGVTVKTLKVVGPGSSTIVAAPQEAHAECRFNVDMVLPSTANVYATYYSSCVPLIDALLDGKHSCLLIYGSSGSGKTSVLNGPPTGQVSGALSSGILPWIASDLLRRLGELCSCELSHENAEIKVSLSAYEVFGNCVYDLMRPPDEPPKDLGFKSTGEGFEAVGAISRRVFLPRQLLTLAGEALQNRTSDKSEPSRVPASPSPSRPRAKSLQPDAFPVQSLAGGQASPSPSRAQPRRSSVPELRRGGRPVSASPESRRRPSVPASPEPRRGPRPLSATSEPRRKPLASPELKRCGMTDTCSASCVGGRAVPPTAADLPTLSTACHLGTSYCIHCSTLHGAITLACPQLRTTPYRRGSSPAESNSKAPSEICGSIAMPTQSSHVVLVLGVERELADGSFHTAKLRLVDLAPSDGIEKDSGLLALGAVLAAMADGKTHLPCRDSTLTKLLVAPLCSQAALLACVRSSATEHAESLATLQFAQAAMRGRWVGGAGHRPNRSPGGLDLTGTGSKQRLVSVPMRLLTHAAGLPPSPPSRLESKGNLDNSEALSRVHIDQKRARRHTSQMLAGTEAYVEVQVTHRRSRRWSSPALLPSPDKV